jgi:signal transduction histidine kinase
MHKPDWLVVGQLALLLALPVQGQQVSLTKASQLSALTANEAAKGLPVKCRGILTQYRPDWNGLFMQDDTGALYVQLAAVPDISATNLQPGRIIEVTGKTAVGAVHCDVAATVLQVLGTGPLPAPLDLSATNLCRVENERLWVKVNGQIFSIGVVGEWPRLQLVTTAGLRLGVSCQSVSLAEVQDLRGSLIELEGVLSLELTPQKRHTGGFDVLVTGLDAIRKTKTIPIIPINELVADGQLARIRAMVEELRPGSLLVRDSSGMVNVQCEDKVDFTRGSAIEVSGYPVQGSNGLVIQRAKVSTPANGNPALSVIDRIAQIRTLSPPEAASGFLVRVTGVVTFNDPDRVTQFMQDETAGIYVNLDSKRFEALPAAGTRIEILGHTGPGDFAPVVMAEELHVLGAGRYPNTSPVPFQFLMTGAEDSQWVELHGVVRSTTTESNRVLVALSTGDAVLQMTVFDPAHHVPSNFIGASISARGVCRTFFDVHRHFQAMGLCVPGWDQVQIQEQEVADPFQLPIRPINGLFEFHAGGYGLNRFHIRGRIILRQRTGAFFVQDDSGGILVQGGGTIPSTDCVEVVGFPALKDQLPVLQDVLVRPAKPTAAPPVRPARLTPESALDESLNATLVTVEGRVMAHSTRTTEESLTVQFGPWFTDAIMEKSDRELLSRFLPASVVRLTGVYVARLGNNRQLQAFQILLRSPADAVLISAPSWWTARHAMFVFGGLGGVLLLSLIWVGALRQQIRHRTAQLRAEIEERKRMEAQAKKAQSDLLELSRQAGMAEVATSVLHNVGNVLNSINVSATLVDEQVRTSGVADVRRVAKLFEEHAADRVAFLTSDPKGQKLPDYLGLLAEKLGSEQAVLLEETSSLCRNVEHVKEIIAMQQNYAKASALRETLCVTDLIEDALRVVSASFARHHIQIVREYATLPPIEVEKHKLLQILVNLLQNAKHALLEGGAPNKRLILRVERPEEGRIRISVIDNGVGIAPENLTRIFAPGFATRQDGHGFGLHSGALAVGEMGGSLTAHSDGPGSGATFVLELPAVSAAHAQPLG